MQRQAFGFGYSDPTTFAGKLNGRVQHFSIDRGQHVAAGEEIVDDQGNPVDASRIVYPTYDPMLGLTASSHPALAAMVQPEELGDIIPEPALPIAYGDEESDEPTDSSTVDGYAFASRPEQQYAQVRTALKNFTDAEKQELIDEGDGGTRAAHLLNLEGTHYQQIPEHDSPEWLW